jgi:hypothetical protein
LFIDPWDSVELYACQLLEPIVKITSCKLDNVELLTEPVKNTYWVQDEGYYEALAQSNSVARVFFRLTHIQSPEKPTPITHSDFQLYPNPFNHSFSIRIPSQFFNLPYQLHCRDASGRIILVIDDFFGEDDFFTIETQSWLPGFYIVSLFIHENQWTYRLVKN